MHSFKDLTITVFRKTPTLKVYHHAYFQRSHYNSIQENTNIKEDTKGRSFMGPFNRNLMKMNSWKLFIPFLLKKKLFVVVVEVLPFFFIKKRRKKKVDAWLSVMKTWLSAAILCLAICTFDTMNKAGMCDTSVVSQHFPALHFVTIKPT